MGFNNPVCFGIEHELMMARSRKNRFMKLWGTLIAKNHSNRTTNYEFNPTFSILTYPLDDNGLILGLFDGLTCNLIFQLSISPSAYLSMSFSRKINN